MPKGAGSDAPTLPVVKFVLRYQVSLIFFTVLETVDAIVHAAETTVAIVVAMAAAIHLTGSPAEPPRMPPRLEVGYIKERTVILPPNDVIYEKIARLTSTDGCIITEPALYFY